MARTPAPSPHRALPIGPTVEAWRAMTPAERDSFLIAALDALSNPRDAMSEGRPHKKAKTRALDMLGLPLQRDGARHLSRGRDGCGVPRRGGVHPGSARGRRGGGARRRPAVGVGCRRRGQGARCRHRGSSPGRPRARCSSRTSSAMGASVSPSTSSTTTADSRIHGYRAPSPDARRYQRIIPQAGRYRSAVLGIDFAIHGGDSASSREWPSFSERPTSLTDSAA